MAAWFVDLMSRGDQRNPGAVVWSDAALRDPHTQPDKAQRVAEMFNAIAPTYERVNTVASLTRDADWRRRAVAAAGVRAGDVVLDVCCGTGDMLRAFEQVRPAPELVVGVDFARQMLACGRLNGPLARTFVVRADALHLPLADASVDVISCAFGVRNFGDVRAGLAEMRRVARPGARIVILEFAMPANRVLRWAHQMYGAWVMPLVTWLLSGERIGAYRYLKRSIRTFESPEAVVRLLERAGFHDVGLERMNLGGVALYRAVAPGGSAWKGTAPRDVL